MNAGSGKLQSSRFIPGKLFIPKLFARNLYVLCPFTVLLILGFNFCPVPAGAAPAQQSTRSEAESVGPFAEVRHAYEASHYERAIDLLKNVASKNIPHNRTESAEIALWMTKSHYELRQFDAAIASGEKAVELLPNSSENHMWLGRSYGRKAERAGVLSAMSLAKKVRREFEAAVRLNPANFDAQQDLIEYYCSAPAIVGGGEAKAQRQIAALDALDPAEAQFARGECFADQKNWDRADAQFQLALRGNQKRSFVFFEIADYFVSRRNADRILEAVDAGAKLAPADSRLHFYRGVAFILKNEKLSEAESELKSYLASALRRMAFPSHSEAHGWLGRLYEQQGRVDAAAKEYRAAVAADSQNKTARESLKRLQH